MSKPTIKTVAVTKRGRFWAVHTDGELLALVLYKKGAMAVKDLLMRMIDSPAEPTGKPR